MRTVYLGTSAFAAAILSRLSTTEHSPVLVVSRPDRPQGRGRKLAPSPTVQAARQLGLDVYQPASVNGPEAVARIAATAPEVLIVCAFGALIAEPLLGSHLILNVHPSLLPRWRGAAPIERAIMAGDPETGVAIMRLEAGLDTGPVCLQERVPIEPEDDYGSLAARLQDVGAELLIRALTESPPFTDQDEQGVTYAEKITAEDRRLDPDAPAAEQADRVRALSPHIGAYLELADGTRLGVWSAHVVDGELQPLIVQPPGKPRMSFADYQRGLRR